MAAGWHVVAIRRRSGLARAAAGRFGLLLALALVLAAPAARADEERLLSFHAEIEIARDGGLTVTETISVLALGRQIKRGIYRDFPTLYRDPFGLRINAPFEAISLTRDGRTEPRHERRIDGGVRTYFGREDYFLPQGVYTYVFRYRTDGLLGFHENHDELYWNVTGNGWTFPIEAASCAIRFAEAPPPGAMLHGEGFTGVRGSREAALGFRVADRVLHFWTTRPLAVQEGLTVRARWPKGHVAPPVREEILAERLRDNAALVVIMAGLLLLLLYYLFTWLLVGADPPPGLITPRAAPPEGLSPAAMRFVSRMGFDDACVSAALLGLAAKGVLTIDRVEETTTLLLDEEAETRVTLSPDEEALLGGFFGGVARGRLRIRLHLHPIFHAYIRAGVKALERNLRGAFEGVLFHRHLAFSFWGAMIIQAAGLAVIVLSYATPDATAESVAGLALFAAGLWFAFGTGARLVDLFEQNGAMTGIAPPEDSASTPTFALLRFGFAAVIHGAARIVIFFRPNSEIAQIVSLNPPRLVVTGGAVLVAAGFAWVILPGAALWNSLLVFGPLLMIGAFFLFHHLLKAPTPAGRALLDRIEGFRLFLAANGLPQADGRWASTRPEEIFERFLPYAVALGLEEPWTDRFASHLALPSERAVIRPDWSPRWYTHSDGENFSDLGRCLGPFLTSTIATSSMTITTSSMSSGASPGGGSDGGGSSGGGGGGGGGGGW